MEDADLDLAVELAVASRLMNSGQVCFSAKRFFVQERIEEEFVKKLTEKVAQIKVGDPMEEDTQIGPMATDALFEKLEEQYIRGLEVSDDDGNKPEVLFGGDSCRDTNTWMPTAVKVPNSQAPLYLNYENDPDSLSQDLKKYTDNQTYLFFLFLQEYQPIFG